MDFKNWLEQNDPELYQEFLRKIAQSPWAKKAALGGALALGGLGLGKMMGDPTPSPSMQSQPPAASAPYAAPTDTHLDQTVRVGNGTAQVTIYDDYGEVRVKFPGVRSRLAQRQQIDSRRAQSRASAAIMKVATEDGKGKIIGLRPIANNSQDGQVDMTFRFSSVVD